jgi:hypothetical protein
VRGAYRELNRIGLSTFGRSQLAASDADFRKLCGDRFVERIEYGGDLWVTVKIEAKSATASQDIYASASGDWAWGDLSAELTRISEAGYGDTVIKVFIHQEGGDPAALAGEIGSLSQSCTARTFSTCQGLINTLTAYPQKFANQLRTNPFGHIVSIKPLDFGVIPETMHRQFPIPLRTELPALLTRKAAQASAQLNIARDLLAGRYGAIPLEKRNRIISAKDTLASLWGYYRGMVVEALVYPEKEQEHRAQIANTELLRAFDRDAFTNATAVDSRQLGGVTLTLFEASGTNEVKAMVPPDYVVVAGGAEALNASNRNTFLNASYPDDDKGGWVANASLLRPWTEGECKRNPDWYRARRFPLYDGYDHCSEGRYVQRNPRTGALPPTRFTAEPVKVWALGLRVTGLEGKALRDAVSVQKFASTSDGTYTTATATLEDFHHAPRLMGGFRTDVRRLLPDDWQPTITWSREGSYPNIWQARGIESAPGTPRDRVVGYGLLFEGGIDGFSVHQLRAPASVTQSGTNVALGSPVYAPVATSLGYYKVPLGCGFSTGDALITKIKPKLDGCEVVAHRPARWGDGSASITSTLLVRGLSAN